MEMFLGEAEAPRFLDWEPLISFCEPRLREDAI